MSFNWHNPYHTPRTPVFARNIVSTSHPLAAQAGNRILLEGGNAVDAAIATAATLTIVEPVSNGLGSDAFALIWADGQLHGLNASGPAPAAWDLNYFHRRYGDDASGLAKRPERGWDTVTVPGAVAGWETLHRRFGKLPFSRLMHSAIEIAERGVTLAPMVARKWQAAVPLLAQQPGFADVFMPDGRAPQTGELFRFPAAARTLRLLADQGARAFYEGEMADAMVNWSQQTGGSLTLQDLQAYQPEWVTPVSQRYRGYDVHEIPRTDRVLRR
ncbi:Putative gamma-glutamyltransferase ywrD [Raoultella terrigena]|uniref:Gamma-glutamyltransferase ywrD n=1 Tax=Raoultella terrigena TaxID=577 RepID=A0A3P8IVV2_RAOTE|nr:Putative gamma-glutamyltransferase ywrD [Raoultella terrigena]